MYSDIFIKSSKKSETEKDTENRNYTENKTENVTQILNNLNYSDKDNLQSMLQYTISRLSEAENDLKITKAENYAYKKRSNNIKEENKILREENKLLKDQLKSHISKNSNVI